MCDFFVDNLDVDAELLGGLLGVNWDREVAVAFVRKLLAFHDENSYSNDPTVCREKLKEGGNNYLLQLDYLDE